MGAASSTSFIKTKQICLSFTCNKGEHHQIGIMCLELVLSKTASHTSVGGQDSVVLHQLQLGVAFKVSQKCISRIHPWADRDIDGHCQDIRLQKDPLMELLTKLGEGSPVSSVSLGGFSTHEMLHQVKYLHIQCIHRKASSQVFAAQRASSSCNDST